MYLKGVSQDKTGKSIEGKIDCLPGWGRNGECCVGPNGETECPGRDATEKGCSCQKQPRSVTHRFNLQTGRYEPIQQVSSQEKGCTSCSKRIIQRLEQDYTFREDERGNLIAYPKH